MKPNYVPLEPRQQLERTFNTSGYAYVKIDGKRFLEHRVIMEKILGRKLEPHEYIHHKNGDRTDNHPDNLELWISLGKSKKDPKGQRLLDIMRDFLNQPEITDKVAVELAFRRVFRI